jgi:hypothetical protein
MKKKIFFNSVFTLLFVGIIVIVSGCSSDSVSKNNIEKGQENKGNAIIRENDDNNMNCFASSLKIDPTNSNIKIKIIDNKKGPSVNKTKKNYTLGELNDLSYGYEVGLLPKKQYVALEVCNGDKTLTFTKANLDQQIMKYEKASNVGNETQGNFVQFNNKQDNGMIDQLINVPGEYQIYVYISENEKNWKIAKKFDFVIKK